MDFFNRPLSKKSFWLLVAAQFLVVLLVVGLILLCRGHRAPRVSPVYERYADCSGITATFVRDFPLNDTLAIDVTLLHATTDPAWQQLREDFGKDMLDPEFVKQMGEISFRFAPKSDYSQPMDINCPTNNDFVSYAPNEQIISIFHINDLKQYHSVREWQIISMMNNIPLSKISNYEENN